MQPYQRFKVKHACKCVGDTYIAVCTVHGRAGFTGLCTPAHPCLMHGLVPLTLFSQVWHFRDAALTFKGFVNRETQLAFQRRIDRLKPVTQPENENITAS